MRLGTTHLNADLDGMAALVALHALEAPLELALPGAMEVSTRRFWDDHVSELPPLLGQRALRRRLEEEPLELLVVADTARADRLGALGEQVGAFAEVRVYDNHPPREGDLARVPLPSTGAVISALVQRLGERGHRPTPAEAGLFLLGIHQDTGHLTFPGTTADDHTAAAWCLHHGADIEWTVQYIAPGFNRAQLALLERMAASARLVDVGGSVVAVCRLELDAWEPDLSHLLGSLRQAEGWPASVLLAATGTRVQLIGRARGGIDIGAVLSRLGGGGHAEAASAVLDGADLDTAEAALGEAIRQVLGAVRLAGDVAVRQVIHLDVSRPIREAADTLYRYKINALPLTDGRSWVGIATRQDVDAALRHGLADRPVGDISAREPGWVPADLPVDAAIRRILEENRRFLLVGAAPGPPLGILTRTTLFRATMTGPDGEPTLPGARRAPGRSRIEEMAARALGPTWPVLVELGELAAAQGLSAWLVGGCVRDIFLGREVQDVDVVVEGADAGPALGRAAVERWGGSLHVHEAFATAHWCPVAGREIDLATARAEHYDALAALPRVLHADLRKDLYRRDFTINAIAVCLDPAERGLLADPFQGQADLRQGVIRVLHGLSFHDDPTRAWRAARFAARFDFALAPQTLSLVRAALRAGVLERLGQERLGAEVHRILAEAEPTHALRLLREWGLLAPLHPGVPGDRGLLDRVSRVVAARHEVAGIHATTGNHTPSQAEVLWLTLAAAIPHGERADRVRLVPGDRHQHQRFLHGPERVRKALGALARIHRPSKAAYRLQWLDDHERIYALGVTRSPRAADWVRWWEREGRALRTAVDGAALLTLGAQPGPRLGEALKAAQAAAWDGEDTEDQLAVARVVVGLD